MSENSVKKEASHDGHTFSAVDASEAETVCLMGVVGRLTEKGPCHGIAIKGDSLYLFSPQGSRIHLFTGHNFTVPLSLHF